MRAAVSARGRRGQRRGWTDGRRDAAVATHVGPSGRPRGGRLTWLGPLWIREREALEPPFSSMGVLRTWASKICGRGQVSFVVREAPIVSSSRVERLRGDVLDRAERCLPRTSLRCFSPAFDESWRPGTLLRDRKPKVSRLGAAELAYVDAGAPQFPQFCLICTGCLGNPRAPMTARNIR